MVKEVPDRAEAGRFTKGDRRIHCSFQSTGACNIGSVNSLDSNGFFMPQKEPLSLNIWKARPDRQCYLEVEHWIQVLEALTVLLTAFDMYQELTDGTHSPSWLLPKRKQLDFRQFKHKLAEQMLAYNPSDKAYPVDALLREATQSSMKQRLAQTER
eukprot:jgi/Psemu1/7115/gm1.7115_g